MKTRTPLIVIAMLLISPIALFSAQADEGRQDAANINVAFFVQMPDDLSINPLNASSCWTPFMSVGFGSKLPDIMNTVLPTCDAIGFNETQPLVAGMEGENYAIDSVNNVNGQSQGLQWSLFRWSNATMAWSPIFSDPNDTEAQNCDVGYYASGPWKDCAPGNDAIFGLSLVDMNNPASTVLGPAAYPGRNLSVDDGSNGGTAGDGVTDRSQSVTVGFFMEDRSEEKWRVYSFEHESMYTGNMYTTLMSFGLEYDWLTTGAALRSLSQGYNETSQEFEGLQGLCFNAPPPYTPTSDADPPANRQIDIPIVSEVITDDAYGLGMWGESGWSWHPHTYDSVNQLWAPVVDCDHPSSMSLNDGDHVLYLPGVVDMMVKQEYLQFVPTNMTAHNNTLVGDLVPPSFTSGDMVLSIDPVARTYTSTLTVTAADDGPYLGGSDGMRTVMFGGGSPSTQRLADVEADCQAMHADRGKYDENWAGLCGADEHVYDFFIGTEHTPGAVTWKTTSSATTDGGTFDFATGNTVTSATDLATYEDSTVTVTSTFTWGDNTTIGPSMAIEDTLSDNLWPSTPQTALAGSPFSASATITLRIEMVNGGTDYTLSTPTIFSKPGSRSADVQLAEDSGGWFATLDRDQVSDLQSARISFGTDIAPPADATIDTSPLIDAKQGAALSITGTAEDAVSVSLKIGHAIYCGDDCQDDEDGYIMNSTAYDTSIAVTEVSQGPDTWQFDIAQLALEGSLRDACGWLLDQPAGTKCPVLIEAQAKNSIGMFSDMVDIKFDISAGQTMEQSRAQVGLSATCDPSCTGGSVDVPAGDSVEITLTVTLSPNNLADYDDCTFEVRKTAGSDDTGTPETITIVKVGTVHRMSSPYDVTSISQGDYYLVQFSASCSANQLTDNSISITVKGVAPTDVPGCTNPTATNYNPGATVDDDSCQFETTATGLDISIVSVTPKIDTSDKTLWKIIVDFDGVDSAEYLTHLDVAVNINGAQKLVNTLPSDSTKAYVELGELAYSTSFTYDVTVTWRSNSTVLFTDSGTGTTPAEPTSGGAVDTGPTEAEKAAAAAATEDDGGLPGFGALLAITGLLGAVVVASARRGREE